MRRWLPYAGITRIRFEGFSRRSSQCANAHPQPELIIRLPPRTVKIPERRARWTRGETPVYNCAH
jgi:hypothetical protein